mmetsp:Transcript_35769/g.106939  ORF Transcript_35769/g.106939 Transcript_35769/m.106939 type:complete len:335 (-) Transcript_35769:29-1033(-)
MRCSRTAWSTSSLRITAVAPASRCCPFSLAARGSSCSDSALRLARACSTRSRSPTRARSGLRARPLPSTPPTRWPSRRTSSSTTRSACSAALWRTCTSRTTLTCSFSRRCYSARRCPTTPPSRSCPSARATASPASSCSCRSAPSPSSCGHGSSTFCRSRGGSRPQSARRTARSPAGLPAPPSASSPPSTSPPCSAAQRASPLATAPRSRRRRPGGAPPARGRPRCGAPRTRSSCSPARLSTRSPRSASRASSRDRSRSPTFARGSSCAAEARAAACRTRCGPPRHRRRLCSPRATRGGRAGQRPKCQRPKRQRRAEEDASRACGQTTALTRND